MGQCSKGFNDDGTGTCVQSGCATGYHEGGDGCVPVGQCSKGYQDGGDGSCTSAGACIDGYSYDPSAKCVFRTMAITNSG
jgi:hypothetical protein